MDSNTKQQYEEEYAKIILFYDLAEELIDTVEAAHNGDPHKQLEFVEPLVQQVEAATDIIAEQYREFVENGKKPGIFGRRRIERALSDIYEVINLCKEVQQNSNSTKINREQEQPR